MKFLIFLALAFATVSAKNFYSRSIEAPVLTNEGRVTRAQIASPGQFNYQVGLDFFVNGLLFWCGGSLIGEKWVLTAAHCTVNAASVAVYLGSTKFTAGEKVHNVTQIDIITHPNWSPSPLENDIALIRIPATNASNNIGFVNFPNNYRYRDLGKNVVVTGWGRTESQDYSDVLQFAILKVSPGNLCFEEFGFYYSDNLNICVATPNKVSPCHGDSGGPLILQEQNLQIGVMSYGGKGDCMDKTPSVFTRVSAYSVWIRIRTGIRGVQN